MALLIGYVPAAIAAGWIGGENVGGIVAALWMAAWMISILRLAVAPCPRCDSAGPLLRRLGRRTCPTCNWPRQLKWSDT